MKTPLLAKLILLVACSIATTVFAQEVAEKAAAPAPVTAATSAPVATPTPASASTTIYRQVLPGGRIFYSDKPVRDVKIDQTIRVEPPIKGHSWTTEAGALPYIAPQTTPTEIKKVPVAPAAKMKRALEDATTNFIRAEMLLEDAKKRQAQGVEPLPGERTGTASGGSRLNEDYEARQKLLAKDVTQAEAALNKATAELNALR